MEPQGISDPSFSFAFQPIVDVNAREVFSYEALLRGPDNQPANKILEEVSRERLFLFDQNARVAAIGLATHLEITCLLNLNLLPQSLQTTAGSIVSTMEAAQRVICQSSSWSSK